jgi:hypothetical protein
MKAIKNLLVVLGFGLLSASAWAQCAPGGQFIEQQGQGVTYGICTYPSGNYYTHGANETPVPTGSGSSGSSGSARPQPPKVINRYGAVAYDLKAGYVGKSSNASSTKEANAAALAECNSKGCQIISSYSNQCVAVAYGYKKSSLAVGRIFTANSMSSSSASDKVLKACAHHAKNCQVILSECSKYN